MNFFFFYIYIFYTDLPITEQMVCARSALLGGGCCWNGGITDTRLFFLLFWLLAFCARLSGQWHKKVGERRRATIEEEEKSMAGVGIER